MIAIQGTVDMSSEIIKQWNAQLHRERMELFIKSDVLLYSTRNYSSSRPSEELEEDREKWRISILELIEETKESFTDFDFKKVYGKNIDDVGWSIINISGCAGLIRDYVSERMELDTDLLKLSEMREEILSNKYEADITDIKDTLNGQREKGIRLSNRITELNKVVDEYMQHISNLEKDNIRLTK